MLEVPGGGAITEHLGPLLNLAHPLGCVHSVSIGLAKTFAVCLIGFMSPRNARSRKALAGLRLSFLWDSLALPWPCLFGCSISTVPRAQDKPGPCRRSLGWEAGMNQ